MAQNESAKPKGQKHKKQMLVRYGKMGMLGWFDHNESHIPKVHSRVVIKTNRGLELGEVVGQYNYRGGQFKQSCEQVEEYFCNRTKDFPLTEGGSFVRFATDEDIMEEKHLEVSALEEAKCCQRFIREMDLPMKVIEAEHLFGGERIIIYFSSSGRVDFRELVRRLAKEYQTRIELRQIGSRDEARLISDFESCGQECCCRRFLKILEPVNMRMAKLQKATLDPSKISGHCGRLKCCLRYEDQTYRDLKKRLPRKNSWVKTPTGVGKVIDTQVLTQLVVVQTEAGKRDAFTVDEIKPTDPPKTAEEQTRDAAEGQDFDVETIEAVSTDESVVLDSIDSTDEYEFEDEEVSFENITKDNKPENDESDEDLDKDDEGGSQDEKRSDSSDQEQSGDLKRRNRRRGRRSRGRRKKNRNTSNQGGSDKSSNRQSGGGKAGGNKPGNH